SNGNVNIRTLTWADYGITYSRVIVDNDHHMIKVGGTLKLLQGIEGGYFYVKNLQYKWNNYDTISVFNTNVKYAYGQGMITSNGYAPDNLGQYAKNLYNFSYSYPSAAVDLGFVYEWRPDKDKYKYSMDCEDQWRYDKNRYKLAVGVSVIDIGGIR